MSNVKKNYTNAELDKMSNDELAALGTELDDVTVAFRKERFPVEGDPAEKRAGRNVAIWLFLSVIGGLGFLGVYLFWPWQYKQLGEEGHIWHTLYTPLLGITAALAICALGIAIVQYVKKILPEEISVQRRHDGPSEEVDRRTLTALLNDSWKTSTLGRRKTVQGLLGGAGVLFGLTVIAPLGGAIKNPWKVRHNLNYAGDGTLWTSGWTPRYEGETIYVARATGLPGESAFVKMRPEDIDAGGMETVFPWRESDGDGTTVESSHHLFEIAMGVRNPVMLIRIKPQDMPRVVKRQGQESFNFGELFAYTKVCSHLGCPSSLYEQQTYRILCPCHQSQFDALHFARPIFGPAARALAQLPITIDEDGYLVANGDFIEPVGPAFWERKS